MNTQQFIIRASAPTIYQYRSVAAFGNTVKHLDGSFSFEESFDTEEEALNYLKGRADNYADTMEELHALYEQINETKTLTLDAVTAGIY